MSKSAIGMTSIIIAASARKNETAALRHTQNEEMNTAKKQVRLPAAVFPCVKGMYMRPNSFPQRLASPSPNASA